MDTNRNVIKEARASLLLPSRPKTPHVNSYSRTTLLPLSQEKVTDSWDNICKRLESDKTDKIWNIVAKMTLEDISEENLTRIMEYLVQKEITRDVHLILKNLTFNIQNHDILFKFGIFQILNQELKNSVDLFVITDIVEIYRNLASNVKNQEYFYIFFQIIQDKFTNQIIKDNMKEIWFNISRICAKLSFLHVFNDFWISKFFDLLVEFLDFKVFLQSKIFRN